MNKDLQRRQSAKDAAPVGGRAEESDRPVVVVGIGASAGGWKSLQELFARMPPGHGVAFVLIQHMEAAQQSLTIKLLSEQTRLTVTVAEDGMPLLADRIHVIPVDKFLNITQSKLALHEPVYCNGLRMPIDHFFCSLAADQQRRAIGIVLSGEGSDGTLGLSEIRAAGGQTFVEDPDSAEFPEMPRNAIAAGVANAVLPAEAMAEAIVALADQALLHIGSVDSPEIAAHLRAILDILRARVGHDFRCYKPNTLVRRIRRRMTLAKVGTFADYARFLGEHPEEVGLLQKDLLIGVTEFFRQPQAWGILEDKVLSALVENARPGSELRVWIPGCSTGKEAYTLAMLLSERVEESGKKVGIQIFATDSDVAALAIARSGNYSREEIGENVSPARLKKFFVRKDGRYQVVKSIREQIVFAPQNITADPPFSRLDLISCRNLLIYLDQEVQKKIVTLFHFALREGGVLFLGSAETIGERVDLFESVSKKWRIYRRIGIGRPVGVEIPVRPTGEPPAGTGKPPVMAPVVRMSLASTAQQMLLDRFAPACVMIDRKLQVLYVHGAVEDYLTFPAGELTTRVVDMAREGLRARLRGAIGKCLEISRSVSVTARVRRGSKSVPVRATVSPLRYPRETDGLLLITFEDYRVPVAMSRQKTAADSDVHQLEDELKVTREELQSTIEQLENSNDQLKASMEEVTAANEELQSANEEMETSKEELQSLNEELNTINARLQEKVGELEDTNNDIVNLLSSTSIATVFLDKELRVKRYTPAGTGLFSLIPSDVTRPIADVLRRFTDEALIDDARRVLADLTPLSKEVQADDGRWYIRRITPYRTQDDRIEGVVVTFVDICDLKETEQAIRRKQAEVEAARTEAENGKRRLEAVMEALPVGMAITDAQGGKIQANGAFEQVWGLPLPPADSIKDYTAYKAWWVGSGKPVAPEEWASARAVRKGETVVGQLLEIQRFDGSHAFILNSASPMRDAAGNIIGSAVAVQDITDLRKAEEELKEATRIIQQHASELDAILETMTDPILFYDAQGLPRKINGAAAVLLGVNRNINTLDEAALKAVWESKKYRDLDGRPMSMDDMPYLRALNGEKVRGQVLCLTAADGREVIIEVNAAVVESDGRRNGVVVVWHEVTERKRAEKALREALDRAAWLARFPEENPNPVLRVSAEGSILYRNRAASERPGWEFEVGQLLPNHLLPLVGRAIAERAEIQQEAQIGATFYSISVYPFPAECYANIYAIDIHKRREAEQEVLRAKNEWERTFDAVPDLIAILDDQHRILRVNRAMAQRLGPPPDQCVGKLCHEAVHGLDCPPDFCPHVLTLADGREHMAEVHEDCLGGDFLVSTTPLTDDQGRHIGSVHVARDITRRKKAEESLRNNEARFKLLSETAARLLATEDPQGMVNTLCREVMTHLDCQAFFNFLVDEEAGRLHLNAFAGIPEEEARKIEWLDYGVAVCGCAARDGVRIVATDIFNSPDPRTELVKSYGIQAYACHPLMAQGRLIGTLSFGTKNRTHFAPEDLAVMRTVTDQVATAMQRIRLIRDLQGSRDKLEIRVQERTAELAKTNDTLHHLSARLLSAQEEERRRIAGEIHDTLGASLSAIKFKVESGVKQMEGTNQAAAESLKSVTPVIEECIAESRRIQMDLRPSILDDLGLLPALSWFCRRFQTIYSGIRVDPEIQIEEEDIPYPLKIVAFRVTQEAMNNVAKHSEAERVHLSLKILNGRMELRIQDPGRGFNPEKMLGSETGRKGFGLTSMRERTELSGGLFAIESAEGKGTVLRASWPLKEN